MTVDEARGMFAYTVWANGLIFDAASSLEPAQVTSQVASSFPSVGATLGHLVGAEWVWLRRWLGESPASVPAWQGTPVLAELRGQLSAVERDREIWLAGLRDADLGRDLSYQTMSGQPFSNRLDDLIRHVVNHSTYHRGQVATQLRQLGVKPPQTDLIAYVRLPR